MGRIFNTTTIPVKCQYILVGGILGKGGTAWFDDFKITIDGQDIESLEEVPRTRLEKIDSDKILQAISKSAHPINLSQSDKLNINLDDLISKIGDKKIIAIGESTHGTSEFYRLRELITKKLVIEKGFNLVVLESPYDDIELLKNRLSTDSIHSLMQQHLFSIYQTQEMKSFLEWFKENRLKYNSDFKGCDDSFYVFNDLLKENTSSIKDERLDNLIEELDTNLKNGKSNNQKKEYEAKTKVFHNIVAIENHLRSTNALSPILEELLFNGKNTYINFVRLSNKKPIKSRDEIMADRVSYLAKNNKVIVWAHNAHISNKIITDGEIGIMGADLKKEFGDNYHSIGLTTLKGSYSYIDEKFINGDHVYDDRLNSASLLEPKGVFWETAFYQFGKDFYLDTSIFNTNLESQNILGKTKLLGYAKESKENIYTLQLVQHFDTLFFLNKTTATKPLFK